MTVELLTEHHLHFLSLKGVCRGSSESLLVKMPHCWKSHMYMYMLSLTNRLNYSSFPYSPQSLRTVLYVMKPVQGTIIRARKRTCIRNFLCEPTDGSENFSESFSTLFFLFSGLFACFTRRNYYYYRLFLYRNLSVQVFIVFLPCFVNPALSHISVTPCHIFVTTLFCIFLLYKSFLLCPKFVVPVGTSKPPGTTMQHVSHVLVAVLRTGVQLARSGLVRFGL